MQAYKNIGAPWRRSNGDIVNHGEMIRPTGIELERMDQRQLIGTRFVPVSRDEYEASTAATAEAPPAPVLTVDVTDDADGEGAEGTAGGEGGEGGTGDGDAGDSVKLAPWPMKMTPRQYLKLHKSGPQAQLAKEYMAAGRGDERGS